MNACALPPSPSRRKAKGGGAEGGFGGLAIAMALLYGKTEKQVMGVSEQKSAK